MYKHILIATDGSELANEAVAHGIALAKEHKAPVTVVTVTEFWSAFGMARKAREGSRIRLNNMKRRRPRGRKGFSTRLGKSRRRRAFRAI
jgi:nucleotide-binding universal stress UspA family protein